MNVSDLLEGAPSGDRRRQQNRGHQPASSSQPQHDRQQPPDQQQQPPRLPPPPPPTQSPQSQRSQQPLPSQQPFHAPQGPRHARAVSPPHSYAADYARADPAQQRLPPPSAIISDAYDSRHRRVDHEPLPHPHDFPPRGAPAPLGPPGECSCLSLYCACVSCAWFSFSVLVSSCVRPHPGPPPPRPIPSCSLRWTMHCYRRVGGRGRARWSCSVKLILSLLDGCVPRPR